MNPIRRYGRALIAAIRFFTRLPLPAGPDSEAALALSVRFFPLIGLLVGGCAALTFWGADLIWSKNVALVLSMVTSLYLTGALHEDGLADMTDGLGGGWDKARILDIMKDPRVGSFGVVALVIALGGKFVLLTEFSALWIPAVLICGHAISRLCASSLMLMLPYARHNDESSRTLALNQPLTAEGFMIAALLIFPVTLLLPPSSILAGSILAAAATLSISGILSRRLGGYTGDCLGGVQQISELAFYLGVLAALPR